MQLVFGMHEHHSWLVVGVSGEIDLSNADLMKSRIDSAVETGAQRVALDLRDVGFMDSSGLRVLMSTHKQLQAENREFAILTHDGPVKRLFEITALDTYLTLLPELPTPD